LKANGQCEYCGAYLSPDKDGYSCVRPVCGKHAILNILGRCEPCKGGSVSAVGGYYCIDAHLAEGGSHDDDDHDGGHRRLETIDSLLMVNEGE